ncbi:4832_t:CDS:2, partial [Rhizophagus irregularis]
IPEVLWNNYKLALCKDIMYHHNQQVMHDAIENQALNQLEHYLLLNGTSLKNFPNMPLPSEGIDKSGDELDQLICEERSYSIIQLENELHQNVPLLNNDQHAIYDAVMQEIEHTDGMCFFVNGPGGTEKTFLYNTLLASVRSHGKIALAVASSGVAALLISGGRTAHSQFKIPIKLNESSTCNISRRIDRPFGGKTFVFEGDFHQVLPVIPRASHADIVSASLSRSFVWKYMKMMKLITNMRLCHTDNSQVNQTQKKFAEILLKIGDGKYPINPNTENMINLPADIVIPNGNLTNLIDFVYPNLVENSGNANYLVGRAILTPKNIDVEAISTIVMDRFPGNVNVYPSADSVELTEDSSAEQPQIYSPEFLRSLKIPDLPPGKLKLKVRVPIILLRNLNSSEGLCNGTRLIICGLQSKVIDAEIMTDSNIG